MVVKWGLETGHAFNKNDLCSEMQATNRLINKGSLLSNEVKQTLGSNTTAYEKTNNIGVQKSDFYYFQRSIPNQTKVLLTK